MRPALSRADQFHSPHRAPLVSNATDPDLLEVGVRYACVMDSVRRWHKHRH